MGKKVKSVRREDRFAKSTPINYKGGMDQTPPPPVPPIPPQPPGWWSRNWKWFVPVGCLTGCLTLVVLIIVFASTIALVVFGAIKSTDIYKDALARAKANAAVKAALGSPIEEGFFISGSTNVNGAAGEANLSIPISGPKGKGTIYVEAKKSGGEWNYSRLVVEIDKTQQKINLLEARQHNEERQEKEEDEDESATDQT